MAALNCGTWRRTATVAALVAAFAAILLGSTSSASASASAAGGPETRVGASASVVDVLVDPPEPIAAGQRLGRAVAGQQIVVATGVAAKGAARSCSFAGATTVLMADGTKKAIEDIEVGDKVIATDPETGEQKPKTVEHVWVHEDTVVDLVVDGEVITTTEDHPFWSVTDQRFERADALSAGEKVLGADGRVVTVSGLEVGTTREALAYNLTVAGIHTYHVGQGEILVHNTCKLFAGGSLSGRSIIGVRSDLLSSGFTQGLARNKKGYLFTHSSGAEARIMRTGGGWEARVKSAGGNYLDEFGNGALDRALSHGIRLVSR